jgi:hypothetical protein
VIHEIHYDQVELSGLWGKRRRDRRGQPSSWPVSSNAHSTPFRHLEDEQWVFRVHNSVRGNGARKKLRGVARPCNQLSNAHTLLDIKRCQKGSRPVTGIKLTIHLGAVRRVDNRPHLRRSPGSLSRNGGRHVSVGACRRDTKDREHGEGLSMLGHGVLRTDYGDMGESSTKPRSTLCEQRPQA